LNAPDHIDHQTQNSVTIIEAAGEWHVRIAEVGRDERVFIFEEESFAMSFAEGHRIRLKLPSVERV